MNEKITAKNFGPIRDLEIIFKKTTLLIGDQGTGKSCIAKIFSVFKWLEKALIQKRYNKGYYSKYNRFKKLLAYHQIDTFLNKNTFISYDGESFHFQYGNGEFTIEELNDKANTICKVMYIPAERSILSIAENKSSLLRQLPASTTTFSDRLIDAKKFFKNGYQLPFGSLTFKYDQLNNVSKVIGEGYNVFLRIASSGIQSALPLCIISEHLSRVVQMKKDNTKVSYKMQQLIEKQVAEILSNDAYSNEVKDAALKELSRYSYYTSFVNIVEEPELNLFPRSLLGVLKALSVNNASTSDNMLLITTHSPYTLAIFNLFIMGYMSHMSEPKDLKEYYVNPNEITAYRLSNNLSTEYCKTIIDNNGLISKNDLDQVSETIMAEFNGFLKRYIRKEY